MVGTSSIWQLVSEARRKRWFSGGAYMVMNGRTLGGKGAFEEGT